MENIFVNYGSSTKRNTNTQTGGFGIGAKSAFSYTDSFTVTSFYNGVRYLYVAHLGDEGGVNLISQNNTTQPNGVEISIGVKPKDIVDFYNAVQRCVKFWSEPIKFFGTRDIFQLKPTLTLGNMTVYAESHPARTIYLIDGIEYDLMEEQGGNYWSRKDNSLHTGTNTVALNIPNGHFKIASSRERLENNDTNKAKQEVELKTARSAIDMIIIGQINNKAKSLKERLEAKKTYSCFYKVSRIDLDLGNNFHLASDCVRTPTAIPYRYVRRGRRGSTHNEVGHTTGVALSVIVITATEDNNLARKLNYYLESNKDKVLVNSKDIANIPFQDILFTNRMDADALPMPSRKASQRTQKSTRDAVCWSVSKEGTRVQWTIEKLNTHSLPVVFAEEITPEVSAIAKHIDVVIIPKCNKDLVLKKGMTLELGKKYLLSKNKTAVLGFINLPHSWDKVDVLKKFKKTTISAELRNYLLSNFPDLKKEFQAMNAEYEDLHVEYPLIRVLCGLAHYQHDHAKILVDAINKQSKGKV
jgi:hypothetical protein